LKYRNILLALFPIVACSFIWSNANADTVEAHNGDELAKMVNSATGDRTINLSNDFDTDITAGIQLKENSSSNITINGNNKTLASDTDNSIYLMSYSGGTGTGGVLIVKNLSFSGDIAHPKTAAMNLGGYAGTVKLDNDYFAGFADNAVAVTGNIDISNSTFKNNTRTARGYSGGAIFAEQYKKSMNISNSSFINNKSDPKSLGNTNNFGGQGGAISSNNISGSAKFSFKNNYFKGNSAAEGASSVNADGGAVGLFNINPDATVDLSGNTFSDNKAGDDAGAVFIQTINDFKDGITFENNTFYNNIAESKSFSAGSGGAVQIYANGSITKTKYRPNPVFTNNTFVKNTANQNGGAIGATGANVPGIMGNSAVGTYKNNIFSANRCLETKGSNSVAIGLGTPVENNNFNFGGEYGTATKDADNAADLIQLKAVFGKLPMVAGTSDEVSGYVPIANSSKITAGSTGNQILIPTIPIAPELSADKKGATLLDNEQRGLKRSDPNSIGSIDMGWVKYDSNGGKFSPKGSLNINTYDGTKYYAPNDDTTKPIDNYYQIANQQDESGVWNDQLVLDGLTDKTDSLSATKAGYTFKGWSTSPKATQPDANLKPDNPVKNDNQTLYAVWGKEAGPTPTPPVTDEGVVNVHYVDDKGNILAPTVTLKGEVGRHYTTEAKTFKGYKLKATPENASGTFSADTQTVTYIYQKSGNSNNHGGGLVPNGTVVYSLKHIYLYKNAEFKKVDRRASYCRKPRINRPMFVVKHASKNKNGRTRYYVRDVNHHSKTDGWHGYITTQPSYIRPVYYRTTAKTITIINPRGVNIYKNRNLTGKVKNIKQGTHLKVTKIVKHNLTTRYWLNNKRYITANRKLVIQGNYVSLATPKRKMAVTIKVINKKGINLYRTNYFSKKAKIRHYKKGTKLTVKKFEYGHPYSRKYFGRQRYVVKGGRVTAHAHFVKVIKTR